MGLARLEARAVAASMHWLDKDLVRSALVLTLAVAVVILVNRKRRK